MAVDQPTSQLSCPGLRYQHQNAEIAQVRWRPDLSTQELCCMWIARQDRSTSLARNSCSCH
jgi:hypothetical protein